VRTGHRSRLRRGLKPILAVLVLAVAALGVQAYRATAGVTPQSVPGPSDAAVAAAVAAAPAAPKAPPGFTQMWDPDAVKDGYQAGGTATRGTRMSRCRPTRTAST